MPIATCTGASTPTRTRSSPTATAYLATDKDYGDFEIYVDWLMVSHNGDSGIYLRGYPQVQIWDVDNRAR